MIEIARIVEDQANLYSYRATQNQKHALQLESLIESTKPQNFFQQWHPLIATPFRYSPPHPNARFRPPFGKNVFYGSLIEETALFEHAFHFMRERMHLKLLTDTGIRTLFFVDANNQDAIHICAQKDFSALIDKQDYSASHHFIEKNPDATFVIYPSCRDPEQRENAAILDIQHLEKKLKWEANIKFFYNNKLKQLTWIDYPLHIRWEDVC